MPFLTIFSTICGITGAYLFCVHALGLNGETFLAIIRERTELTDLVGGLIKSTFFGLIISVVGTYKGYLTTGGAQGVGIATTQSVVVGSIMVLIANYFLSSLLFQIGIA